MLIIFLAVTGFEVHGNLNIFGFEEAARFHRHASWLLIALIVFAIFWHTLGAFLLMVFLVVHVYMTTTGKTPASNIRAMITGYEELEDDDAIKIPNSNIQINQ